MTKPTTKNAALTVGYDASEKAWAVYSGGAAVRYYHTEANARSMADFFAGSTAEYSRMIANYRDHKNQTWTAR